MNPANEIAQAAREAGRSLQDHRVPQGVLIFTEVAHLP